MICEVYKPMISKYIDGELSEKERAELERHMIDCADCRAELEELRENEEVVAGVLKTHPFTRDFARGIVEKLPRRAPVFARRWRAGVMAMAACAVVAVVLSVVFSGGEPVGPSPENDTVAYVNTGYSAVDEILADGTSLSLAGGSDARVRDTGEEMHVTLTRGQIFIASAEVKTRKLVVLTPEAAIRPLGTEFDVLRTVQNGRDVTVLSVIKDRVEITAAGKTVVVEEGEQYVASADSLVKSDAGEARRIASWKLGPVEQTPSGTGTPIPPTPNNTVIQTPPSNENGSGTVNPEPNVPPGNPDGPVRIPEDK